MISVFFGHLSRGELRPQGKFPKSLPRLKMLRILKKYKILEKCNFNIIANDPQPSNTNHQYTLFIKLFFPEEISDQ
jgi:hypothetical protein